MKQLARLLSVCLLIGLACFPAMAQTGCMPFYMPAGPEYGNFNTGVWYAEGTAYLGQNPVYIKINVQDYGGMGKGKTANVYQGTEIASYDFGNGNTFQTFITYVVQHNNDPTKLYMNAVEKVIAGSGTGIFAKATGTLTDHGTFGLDENPTVPGNGWALFRMDGAICGIK